MDKKKFDVSFALTLTVEVRDEATDDEIVDAYMNSLMNRIQCGELGNEYFSIEEAE